MIFVIGNTVIDVFSTFVAVERTAIPGRIESNATVHNFYVSSNYTIYDTAFPVGKRPASGASASTS